MQGIFISISLLTGENQKFKIAQAASVPDSTPGFQTALQAVNHSHGLSFIAKEYNDHFN